MADRQPRKRRRVAKSCDQCRQRKVRCDRNIPCGPCTRARASLNCSYCHESSVDRPVSDTRIPIPQNAVPARSVSTTASNGGEADSRSTTERTRGDSHPRLHSPPPGQQSIQDLRRRLQSLENQISDRESHNAPVTHEPTLEQALRDLTTKVQRIEQRLSPPTGPAEVCQAGDLSISPIWPRLLGPGSKMKLLGPTHWNHGMDRVCTPAIFRACLC